MLDQDSKFEYILDLCESLSVEYLRTLVKRIETMANYKEMESE